MKNKKMSIRILFPLIMSVSIAFCIISCMILFSHYLSAYFIQKTVEDTNRQKMYLHKILKTKLNPSMIQLTRFIMIQLKNMIFRMKRFLRYYRIQKTVLQSILTGLPYMISTELLYGILRIYQPHLLLRKAGLHKQKIISKQFIMDQRSSSILIK